MNQEDEMFRSSEIVRMENSLKESVMKKGGLRNYEEGGGYEVG